MTPTNRAVYRREQLARLLMPTSIAIVGASPNQNSFASRTLANLAGYTGRIHLVNPKYDRLGDIICHPSISALPETPDCVLAAVGRETLTQVVEEAGQRGCGGVVIYASGFAETGQQEFRAQQHHLTTLARRYDMRIVGPNCVGVLNYGLGVFLTFAEGLDMTAPRENAIGIVSQSGAIGNSIGQGSRLGYSFSHMLSAGNSCDVEAADFVSYLAGDEHCRVIVCVIEGTSAPERLLQAGEIAAAAGKPLVIHKIATGDQGAAAALSHTGSLAGSSAAYRALFNRMGAIVVENIEEIAETAAFFAKAPRPRSKGVGVVSLSGGYCIIHADKAELHGVPLPQPNASVRARLQAILPDFGSIANPCDATGVVLNSPRLLEDACEAFLADPDYDTVVLPHSYAAATLTGRIAGLARAAQKHRKIGCCTWVNGWLDGPGAVEAERDSNLALFRSTTRCFRTLAAWHKREDWLRARERDGARALVRRSPLAAPADSARLLDSSSHRALTEREAKEVLAVYGIPVVEERLVHTADEAVEAARSYGFPVVLKVESPDILHKTEAGGVLLDLRNEFDVGEGFSAIMMSARKSAPDAQINGIVVQPMISKGVEVMVGARRDPVFGPLVLVGLGGVLVELVKDVEVELAPITPPEALGMLNRLKASAVLKGFRGNPPVDLDALADILCRVSELAADQADRIEEFDINPLVCTGTRIVAVDALIVRADKGRVHVKTDHA